MLVRYSTQIVATLPPARAEMQRSVPYPTTSLCARSGTAIKQRSALHNLPALETQAALEANAAKESSKIAAFSSIEAVLPNASTRIW